jgi:hypothetical protein
MLPYGANSYEGKRKNKNEWITKNSGHKMYLIKLNFVHGVRKMEHKKATHFRSRRFGSECILHVRGLLERNKFSMNDWVGKQVHQKHTEKGIEPLGLELKF